MNGSARHVSVRVLVLAFFVVAYGVVALCVAPAAKLTPRNVMPSVALNAALVVALVVSAGKMRSGRDPKGSSALAIVSIYGVVILLGVASIVGFGSSSPPTVVLVAVGALVGTWLHALVGLLRLQNAKTTDFRG